MPIRRAISHDSNRSSGPHSPDTCALSLKWAFKLMLDLGGHRNLIQRQYFNDDELATELGLRVLIDDDGFKPSQALLRLRAERKAFDMHYCEAG